MVALPGRGRGSRWSDPHGTDIEIKPYFAATYNNRANDHLNLKEYDKAWADVRTCRQLGGTPHPNLVKELREATGKSE